MLSQWKLIPGLLISSINANGCGLDGFLRAKYPDHIWDKIKTTDYGEFMVSQLRLYLGIYLHKAYTCNLRGRASARSCKPIAQSLMWITMAIGWKVDWKTEGGNSSANHEC